MACQERPRGRLRGYAQRHANRAEEIRQEYLITIDEDLDGYGPGAPGYVTMPVREFYGP